ncbi:vesicle-associated membrane protein-associated protein Scs2p [Monosporozyma unispora]|nr:phosphatidylinositol-binding protein scs2 [Kazachstania unispora]
MPSIEIRPDVLEYNPPLTEQSTEYATITNNSSETIAFKVKTTAPKYYCVRPNAAVVAPGETVQIQVIFLGLPEEPNFDSKCKDKFLVITLPAPHDLGDKSVADAWSELESEFSAQAVSKKIRVKYGHRVKPEVSNVEDDKTTIPVDTKREAFTEEEEKETTSSNEITPTSASADLSSDNKEDVTEKKSDEEKEEAKENSPVTPQAPSLYPPIIVAIVAVLMALIVRQYFF